MIYPIRYAFVTGIDMGIRYPMYVFNSYGRLYPITKPYELITYSNYLDKKISREKSKLKKKLLLKEKRRYFEGINDLLSEYIIRICPLYTVLAIERISQLEWMKDIPMYDLLSKIQKKSANIGIELVQVDAYNTSNTCPRCGNINRENRNKTNHLYICNKCGLICNDDAIAAWNIHNLGFKMAFGREYINTINGYKPVVIKKNQDIEFESLIPE